MRRLLVRACLSVFAFASSLAPAMAGVGTAATQTFAGWTATCNNLGACVVIATAQDDLFYVRIARAAGAPAPPDVKIVLAAQEPQKGGVPAFRLTAVGADARAALGPFPAIAAKDDPSVLSATIAPGEPSLAFVAAIREAATLDYAVLAARGTLELKGLAPALRFIDEMQGRGGTPTALVARGMAPVDRVPAPPPVPVVTAAPAGSAAVVDKPVVTQATRELAASVCDADVVKDQSEVMAWRVGGDRVLVAVPCTQGAYNLTSALYLTTPDGAAPKAAELPRLEPPGSDTAANVVVNTGFNPKTMELTSLDKGRGLGDCGTSTTWIWTGQAFVLFAAYGLDACPGALPEDWPNLYTARRR